MLVLTRKVGDTIAIGDDIKIIVMAVKGKQVRLGIDADKSTVIHREEVYQKIHAETKRASKTQTEQLTRANQLVHQQRVRTRFKTQQVENKK